MRILVPGCWRELPLALAVFAALTVSAGAETSIPSQPAEVDIRSGQDLYAENCAACHGINLEGQENWRVTKPDGTLPAPPHDESGHTWHHGDGLVFEVTRDGGKKALEKRGILDFNSGMPGFGDQLTDQEIWNVIAYIKSTWPAHIQKIQAERTEFERQYGN